MDKSRKQLTDPKMSPCASAVRIVSRLDLKNLGGVRRFPVIVLVACFIGLSLLLAARPVAANGSPWVRWKVNLGFPNNNVDAWLTIERGHTTASGDQIADDRELLPISCTAYGNPTIVRNTAFFDGSSFYRCEVPSIQAEAMRLWSLFVPDTCESKRPYIRGTISFRDSPVNSTPENPIFFREDIQFNAPLDVATQEAKLAVRFGQVEAESDPFPIGPAEHYVGAYFAPFGPNSFAPTFLVDGHELASTPASLPRSAAISTLASDIYIGYSPRSGEYFEGRLKFLEADPVCPTTG